MIKKSLGVKGYPDQPKVATKPPTIPSTGANWHDWFTLGAFVCVVLLLGLCSVCVVLLAQQDKTIKKLQESVNGVQASSKTQANSVGEKDLEIKRLQTQVKTDQDRISRLLEAWGELKQQLQRNENTLNEIDSKVDALAASNRNLQQPAGQVGEDQETTETDASARSNDPSAEL